MTILNDQIQKAIIEVEKLVSQAKTPMDLYNLDSDITDLHTHVSVMARELHHKLFAKQSE